MKTKVDVGRPQQRLGSKTTFVHQALTSHKSKVDQRTGLSKGWLEQLGKLVELEEEVTSGARPRDTHASDAFPSAKPHVMPLKENRYSIPHLPACK